MATPGSIQYWAGSYQAAQPGMDYPTGIRVRALDSGGVPMANEPLVWGTAVSGASAVFTDTLTRNTNTLTDASGFSNSPTLRANTTLGDWVGAVQFVNNLAISGGFYTLRNMSYTPVAGSIAFNFSSNVQTKVANSQFSELYIVLKDQNGAVMPGVEVSFNAPGGRGVWQGTATTIVFATTNANGECNSTRFNANNVLGALPITVSATGLNGGAAKTAVANWNVVSASTPATVVVQAGNNQNTNVNTQFANALQAKVLNGAGGVLSGINVTFTGPTAPGCTFGGAASEVKVTNASGIATSTKPTADFVLGTYNVVASIAPATPANFNLTNGGTPIEQPMTPLHMCES